MEPNDNNDYEYEEQNGREDKGFKLKGIRGLGHKLKNGLKRIRKNATAAVKLGLKAVFKKYAIIGAVIFVVIIIFLSAFLIILQEETVRNLTTETEEYFASEAFASTLTKEAKSVYEDSGSLVMATDQVIKNISDLYLESIMNRLSVLHKEMTKTGIVGTHNIKDIEYAKNFDIANASEFILNAERLNFNRIIWKEITRKGELNDLSLKTDEATKLKYPSSDKDKKELVDFANMVAPYIQSYIVPSSMLSGLTAEDVQAEAVNFAYQIIHNGYNKLRINQYDIQNITRYRLERPYVEMSFEVEIYEKTETRTETVVDDDGNKTEVEVEVTVQGYNSRTHSQNVAIIRAEFDKQVQNNTVTIVYDEPLAEEYESKDRTIANDYVYAIVEAQTLKDYMTNNYVQIRYNDNDVNIFENYDTKNLVFTDRYLDVNSLPSRTTTGGGDWTFVGMRTYTMELGERKTYEYYWQDELELLNQDTRPYAVEDIDSYIDTGEIVLTTYDTPLVITENTEEQTALEEQLKQKKEKEEYKFKVLTASEQDYYSEIQSDEKITKVDMINANPEMYETYLGKDEEYSEHVGLAYAELRDGYRLMSKYLDGLTSSIDSSQVAGQLDSNLASINVNKVIGFSFLWPVNYEDGWITSCSGNRISPLTGSSTEFHGALDIGSLDGSIDGVQIYAAQSGVVDKVGTNLTPDGYGYYVVLRHDQDPDNTIFTLYAHMKSYSSFLKEGDNVEIGQVIGYVGNTGGSRGSHLHFEIIPRPKTDTKWYYKQKIGNLEPLYYIQKETIPELTLSHGFAENCGDLTEEQIGTKANE